MRSRVCALLIGTALLAAACAATETTAPTSAPASESGTAESAGGQTADRAEDAPDDSPAATAQPDAPGTTTASDTDAVVLDPRDTGKLRNFLGYTFPPAPEVPAGPLQRTVLNDLNMIWSGLQRGGIDGDAVAQLGRTGDPRLAWIVADLLRFVPPGELTEGAVSAFQSLTGVRLFDDPVARRSPWQSVTDHLLA